MDPFSIGTLATGAISSVGNLFSSIFGSSSAEKANAREARLNREFQREMWDKQNAYNTPAAQIGRLEDAGLNPALAYGSVSSGNSQNLPSGGQATIPQMQNPDLSALSNSFSIAKQLEQRDQEIYNQNAYQTDLGEAALINAKAHAKEAGVSEKELDEVKIPKVKQEIQESGKRIQVMASQITEALARVKNINKDTDLKDEQIGLVRAQTENVKGNTQNEKRLTEQRIQSAKAEIAALRQRVINETRATEAQVKEADARVKKLVQETDNLKTEQQLKKFELALKNATKEQQALMICALLDEKIAQVDKLVRENRYIEARQSSEVLGKLGTIGMIGTFMDDVGFTRRNHERLTGRSGTKDVGGQAYGRWSLPDLNF